MDAEIARVLRIAREASDRVAAIYATPFEVELKGPGDPVTRADREANDLICDALSRAFPGDAIIAEESVPESEAEIARLVAHDRVWYVDPLDGTREFADKNGEFAVMIGLAVKGRAALGVLVMPVSGDALIGRVGAGAIIERADGSRATLSVSAVADPREATLVVSRSHRPAIIDPVVNKLGITRLVPCGSVGVKVSRIVLGAADVYLHGGRGAKRWDTCGPEAVLVAAGGRFSDLDGAPIDYASADLHVRRGIVATNGALFDEILGATRGA